METFQETGLPQEWVAALAEAGLTAPTALQEQAMPVVNRGNNLVAVSGPGSGVLVATAVPLLARLAPAPEGGPVILLATATADRARALSEALSRLARGSAHRVAALGGGFRDPESASVLCGTPGALLERIRGGHLSIESVGGIVVDDAAVMVRVDGAEPIGALLDSLPTAAQRVMVALPLTPAVDAVIEKHFGRAVRIPTDVDSSGPDRGQLALTPLEGSRDEVLVRALTAPAAAAVERTVVFVRSDARIEEMVHGLRLRGFEAGRCAEAEVPVWVAADPLEARAALEGVEGSVALISFDVPADEDELDRRHGSGRGGRVLAEPREIPHLRTIARRAGYAVQVERIEIARPERGGLSALLTEVEAGIEAGDVDVYQTALEPLFERHGAPSVAASILALLRARPATPAARTEGGDASGMAKLFISIGSRDGVGPRDLLGAITGESGVKGDAIGKIDLKESFSIVEVRRDQADTVIRALNGTTIRGRSTRVDYDRSERSGGRGRGGDGDRGGRGRGGDSRSGGGRGHRGGGGRRDRPGPGPRGS